MPTGSTFCKTRASNLVEEICIIANIHSFIHSFQRGYKVAADTGSRIPAEEQGPKQFHHRRSTKSVKAREKEECISESVLSEGTAIDGQSRFPLRK